MCVNSLTIKDKLPIPIIDELLDELGEVKIFSKLDLRVGLSSSVHEGRRHSQDCL